MTTAFLTAIHGREALTRLVLGTYHSDGPQIAVHSMPGDGGSRLARALPAWSFYYWPNDPLGNKWQMGLHHLRRRAREFGAVLTIGSDNLLTPAYLQRAGTLLREGCDYIRPRTLHIYDAATGRLVRCTPAWPGAGRLYSRRLLDALGWRLWPHDATWGLDTEAQQRVERLVRRRKELTQAVIEADGDAAVLDVKTGTNIWHLDGEALRRGGAQRLRFQQVTELDAAVWLRAHVPAVAETLLHWKEPEEVL